MSDDIIVSLQTWEPFVCDMCRLLDNIDSLKCNCRCHYNYSREAIQEIEHLRSLVRELKPFVEMDINLALSVEPHDPFHETHCEECQWRSESLAWKERLESGELDV